MKEFFIKQSDYILFFYGFSFFLMGLICLTLGKKRLNEFPWVFLGFFGLSHGFHEWVEMSVFIFGEKSFSPILDLISLAMSFIFLFEFARRGSFQVREKGMGLSVYLFLFVPLFLGLITPQDKWEVIIRYLIGFPSAYFAGRMIYEFSGRQKEGRRALITLSVILSLYAVFTGLVVRKADFIPANIINNESFIGGFMVPPQLMRGILALGAAIAIWYYSIVSSEREYDFQLDHLRFVPDKFMISLVLVVFIGGGWVFTNYLEYYVRLLTLQGIEAAVQYRLFAIALTFLECVVAVLFLITLRRRELFIIFMEKMHVRLEEVDKMKTDFVSVVSHELRTPLTSIKNAADILMQGGTDKRQVSEQEKEILRIIFYNVDRQTKMVTDLLDISKIEAKAMPIYPDTIDISRLIRNVIGSLNLLAEGKNINIDFAADTPEKIVFADPELVTRILNNLIVNAINFTPQDRGITIRVEDAADEIRVSVSDTGIGIAVSDIQRLFKNFCRLPGIAAPHREGCGLGLAISKGLVESQGGRIGVYSRPGKGSTFYFTLPRQKRDLDAKKNIVSR